MQFVAVLGGMGFMAHGVSTFSNGANNLVDQNGRVKAEPIKIEGKNKIPRDQLNSPKKPGNAPTFKKDNKPVEIHHEGQNRLGPWIEMHPTDHRGKGNDKEKSSKQTKTIRNR